MHPGNAKHNSKNAKEKMEEKNSHQKGERSKNRKNLKKGSGKSEEGVVLGLSLREASKKRGRGNIGPAVSVGGENRERREM